MKTAKELKNYLKEGAKVKMTRTTDKYVSLDDRNIKGDAFISIHNDSLDSSNANGATVYWLQDNQESLAQTLNSNIQKKPCLLIEVRDNRIIKYSDKLMCQLYC